MKKSYIRLIIFEIILFLLLFLNSFISSILNGYYMVLFLLTLLVIFKFVFGFEKDRHRYVKDTIFDILIILLIGFLLFYLFGLIIGFVRTENFYSVYGMKTFVLPLILTIILKELLKYYIVTKSEGSKLLIVMTTVLFIFFDITVMIPVYSFSSSYDIFMFFAVTLLPSISNNIVSVYICSKLGYKPNLVWLLTINLYKYLLPIVPDTGEYILSVIEFIFPLIIAYKVYYFFEKEKDKDVERYHKRVNKVALIVSSILVVTLVYFTSGEFHYHAVAIASGSMMPNISRGDVVVIEKIDNNFDKLEVGMVLAYRYDGIIIVHRIINIVHESDEYYFYTKGDANYDPDRCVISEDMVVGIVNVKIPYIGYPTVLLNEL